MCLAIPGRIKSIEGRKAIVEYPGEERAAMIGEDNVQVGDYVQVQMGIVMKKLTEEQAKVAMGAWEKK